MPDTIDKKIKKDKTLVVMLFLAIPSLIYFGLSSATYPLGYSVLTLGLMMIIGTILSRPFIYEKNVAVTAFIMIPIALRLFVSHFLYASTPYIENNVLQLISIDAMYAFQVVGLMSIVAFAEEGFRGAMISLGYALFSQAKDSRLIRFLIVSFVNVLWIAFHFIQRKFVLSSVSMYYVLWLLITGYILSYILLEAGFGNAVLAHFLVNLTA